MNAKTEPASSNPWTQKMLPMFICDNTDFTRFGGHEANQITAEELMIYLGNGQELDVQTR